MESRAPCTLRLRNQQQGKPFACTPAGDRNHRNTKPKGHGPRRPVRASGPRSPPPPARHHRTAHRPAPRRWSSPSSPTSCATRARPTPTTSAPPESRSPQSGTRASSTTLSCSKPCARPTPPNPPSTSPAPPCARPSPRPDPPQPERRRPTARDGAPVVARQRSATTSAPEPAKRGPRPPRGPHCCSCSAGARPSGTGSAGHGHEARRACSRGTGQAHRPGPQAHPGSASPASARPRSWQR